MNPAPVSGRGAQVDAVLQASLDLLGARQDQMLAIGERTSLPRAASQEGKTADHLTDHDVERTPEGYALEWNHATDGPLPAPPES